MNEMHRTELGEVITSDVGGMCGCPYLKQIINKKQLKQNKHTILSALNKSICCHILIDTSQTV